MCVGIHKDFWEWMSKMRYGAHVSESDNMVIMTYIDETEANKRQYVLAPYVPTEQMIVGHMIEYLVKKGFISFRQLGIWLANEIKSYLLLKNAKYGLDNPDGIVFEILKSKINEVNK